MKRNVWKVIGLLGLFLFLAGCATEKVAENGGKSNKEKSGTGGELKVALSANIASLDPTTYTAQYESNVMRSIYNTLLVYDSDIKEFKPSLATSWEISDDLKTYTFVLRDDVYFQKGKYQDGRKMVAEDVKYSLERSLETSALNRLRYVKNVEVKSDTALTVELETPYAGFLAMLTDMGNVIVPQEEAEGWGDDFARHPVGTGPFSFVEWSTDDYVLTERNETYWGDRPKLDTVRFSFIIDSNMMGNSLQAGDIDVATSISGQNIPLIEKNESLSLEKTQGLSIGYLSFNTVEGPTADVKVRKAMALAVDKDELVKGIYQYGEASSAYLPLPKASWGYSQKVEAQMKAEFATDIEAAKGLLAEAGHKEGFKIELYTSEARVPVATIFQAQMKALKIDVEIKSVEWGTFSDIVANGKAPLYIMGWSWYPDPDFFLYQMLHSAQIGSLGNGGQYKNEQVDELLDRGNSETADEQERAAIYEEALELIKEDVPHVDLYDQDIIVGLSQDVNGYKVRADGSIIIVDDETNVWLDR
ncbi:ABC transporter substrate-binding protein [Vagococcus sp. BWB3-3]|uniref:ABC transporter substrate-binding protein n=1 Tax=Vagococcus allomyrinae TaxID=2794353 RepID=A0A940PAB5_9ENTE|nr:ABC transporter substrate-binding protein [Vagococcus allomyrinae]MBP1043940.1 ABC transporter substrate-binding protein [Vagococcus allomyrinae]